MAKTICILFFSVLCFHSSVLSLRTRIAGGVKVNIEKYPYQATLTHILYGESLCGAAIIAHQWLITAGHCFVDLNITDIRIRTGATKRYDDGEYHEIEETYVHPDMVDNSYSVTNDIALVKVKKPIVYSEKQKPIPLAGANDVYPPGTIMTISGFGREGIPKEKKVLSLKAVSTPVVNLKKCQKDYLGDPITDHMICAGVKGDSPCVGDSGGPAVISGKLAGIISTGFNCNTRIVPAIFTAVNKYLDWINKYVKYDDPFISTNSSIN